jgi:hypothetical protein
MSFLRLKSSRTPNILTNQVGTLYINYFLEFDFPDKYHLRFLDEGILELLLSRLKTDIDSTCYTIAKALTKLASKSMYYSLIILN